MTFRSAEEQFAEYFLRHEMGPETPEEQARRFWSSRKVLYWKAERMRQLGKKHQYRSFGVGAAALVFRNDRHLWEGGTGTTIGYNSKQTPVGRKCCAERRLFNVASAMKWQRIVGIVVVGLYQPDDTSKHECTTLHPCLECREMMRDHPLARMDMPIITALPPPEEPFDIDRWEPEQEWHTLGEILDIHRTPRGESNAPHT